MVMDGAIANGKKRVLYLAHLAISVPGPLEAYARLEYFVG